MTLSKIMCENETTAVGRRCINGQFYLTPDKAAKIKAIIGFLYTHYLNQYKMTCHSFMCMSNHYHAVQTDKKADRSKFFRDFHHFVTVEINRELKRSGGIWDPYKRPYDCTLLDEGSMKDMVLYTLLNPVRANMVAHVSEYEHFCVTPDDWGKTIVFKRPDSLHKRYPKEVYLTPEAPPFFEKLSTSECTDFFNLEIAELEEAQRIELLHNKKEQEHALNILTEKSVEVIETTEVVEVIEVVEIVEVVGVTEINEINGGSKELEELKPTKPLGMAAIYDMDHNRCSPPPKKKRNAPFKAACPVLRRRAKKARRDFLSTHKDCNLKFKKDKTVVFPYGTYNKRVLHGANVQKGTSDMTFYPPSYKPEPRKRCVSNTL